MRMATCFFAAVPAAAMLAGQAAMMTPWGEKVTSENAWREYPRPQMQRAEWTCLNGDWDYAITSAIPMDAPREWAGKIRVPFAIEAPLSGVGRALEPDELLWYRRRITVTPRRGYRTLLHFESVDFRAQVFIGHRELDVPHESLNVPFSFDITDVAVPGENELTVCVWDPTEQGEYGSTGKQITKPKGTNYTRASGILGSVWMETVPQTHLTQYRVLPDFDGGAVRVTLEGAGDLKAFDAKVEVLDGGRTVAGGVMDRYGEPIVVRLPEGWKAWTPESPNLYGLRITVADARASTVDVVNGYFGMRKIERRKDSKGILRFYLNNEPRYIFGTLDQGWWPDGLLTPPSDDAMRFDIQTLKDCGFNAMRKHIKVEPRRYYWLCDTMGIMVLQDMPSDIPDLRHGMDVGHNPDTVRYAFHRRDWKRVMDSLYNSPSIVMWVPYNEGWGQPISGFLTHTTIDWTKNHDPSRLVDGPSGWNDREGGRAYAPEHGWRPVVERIGRVPKGTKVPFRELTQHRPESECEAGDAVDVHHYPEPEMPAVNSRRVSFLGEYGGVSLKVPGHVWNPETKEPARRNHAKGPEALRDRYLQYAKTLELFAADGLGGSIYTQTTDVEHELNGLLTYDRRVLKIDAHILRKANEAVISAAAEPVRR